MSTPESNRSEPESEPFQEQIRVSDSLVLRLPAAADAQRILELTEQNRGDLKVWFPWAEGLVKPADAEKYVIARLEAAKDKSILSYLIEQNGQVAGAISGRFNWQLQSANIGYWLGKEFRGQGIAEKSLRALAEYCFAGLNLHRLELDIAVDNSSSASVAEKVGFIREGVRREAWPDQNTYHDMAVYGLLKSQLTQDDTQAG